MTLIYISVDLIQTTLIYTTMGKNLLEEMEWPSLSTEVSEMQYLDAISETTESFLSKPFTITVIQVYAPTGDKRSERQRRKGKIHSTECRVPDNS